MKKNNFWKLASMALAMFAFGFTSCNEEDPTEVAKNEAATVEGFVTYKPTINNVDQKNTVVKGANVTVSYSYKLTVNGEEVTVSLSETVQTDKNGWYAAKLNVPAGKTADYNIYVTFTAENDSEDANENKVYAVECLFKGKETGSVAYGNIDRKNIEATSAGIVNKGY